MSIAVLLGLGAAVGFGVSDYLAGVYSRRFGILAVLAVAQVAGLVVLMLAAPFFGGGGVATTDLAWGVVAGVATAGGILLLLKGFRAGRLTVVSPVSSLGAAGIPLIAGLLLGEEPSRAALAGLAAGLVAIWLVSSGAPDVRAGERSTAAGFWYGIGAGVGFALMFLALARADAGSGIWPILSMQVALVIVILAALYTRRQVPRMPRRALPGITAIGIAGALGIIGFLYAARVGLVSIAAVIASLSPAVTVMLARMLLAESLSSRQIAGLALAGIALILIGLD